MKRYKPSSERIPCSECRIGMMRPAEVNYFAFIGSRLITVPDFPAWICDICGKCEYDTRALESLSWLLGHPSVTKNISARDQRSADFPGAHPRPPLSK